MGHPVRIPKNEVVRALQMRNRQGFCDALARLLEGIPDANALRSFANRHPDRWAQAVAILARLSGFHERLQVSVNKRMKLSQMSDAELISRLERLDPKLECLKSIE